MEHTAFPATNELLLRPIKLYPTLLQGIIPSPFLNSKDSNLFDIIKTIDYPTHDINSKDVLDRCVMNVVTYGCEYSEITMTLIADAVEEVRRLTGLATR